MKNAKSTINTPKTSSEFFTEGCRLSELKNYDSAIKNFDKAIE